jgi:hypothetical protein
VSGAPAAGDRGVRALRYTDRAGKSFRNYGVGFVLLAPLVAWLFLTGKRYDSTDFVAVTVGFVVLAVGPLLYTYLRVRGLRLVGTRLVRGRKDCDLTSSWAVSLDVKARQSRPYLILRADGFRVTLGSGRLACYFEPEDLRRLAEMLERSQHPEGRAVGQQLRRIAEAPFMDSWPPARPG